MTRKNIFYGDSYYSQFAVAAYNRLMTRKWVKYTDIMADYLRLKLSDDLPYNISSCNQYGELKKAFRDIRKHINEKLGYNGFEEERDGQSRRYRYIGKADDPLEDMRKAKVINNLKQYWQFCQNSAGFFPTSWLEYFFKDCLDLLEIKNRRQKGEQVLSASLDRMLTNIDLLPFLYDAIINKQVLSIDYKPYEEDVQTLIFHPHYLKEYNGRWHLFGHVEERIPENGYNIALDRIVNRPREMYKYDYIAAPKGFYNDFFNDIVGVSHLPNAKIDEIRIRAHTYYVFKLTETKKIHRTQDTTIPYGKHEDGEYGEFSLRVEVNNEFIGRILQMGAGLEIVAPNDIREEFKKRVVELYGLYS